ncbi:hypothetical protein B0H19DRAFT_1192712 [Mycena capillaripes]|nr:hypothetical protein B0H19DRAFT_1192712 [Mycena capillaripes]
MDLPRSPPTSWPYASYSHGIAQNSPAMRFFELHMGPHDLLFVHIPTYDLVRLMCTCRCVYSLVKNVCFDLHRLLLPFFGDTTEVQRFRLMQSLTDTLISGSMALQYFNRLTWPESDLDVYAYRPSAHIAVDFVVTNGYTYDPRKSQNKNVSEQLSVTTRDRPPSYLGRGIADVLDFHKGAKRIQVIVAESTPMETILGFHSTVVMNVITHDNAFALYPHSTFATKQALVVGPMDAGKQAGRQNKSELGVRLLRWVGDKFTWTMSLPPLTIDTTDLCRINSWQLDYDFDEKTRTTWGMLSTPSLRYKYITGDPGTVSNVLDEIESRYSTNLEAEFSQALTRRREAVDKGLLPF